MNRPETDRRRERESSEGRVRVLLLASAAVALVLLGAWLERSGFFAAENFDLLARYESWREHSRPSEAGHARVIRLELGLDAFARLEEVHRRAVRRRWLAADEKDFVEAQLSVGDETTEVRVRLEGSRPEHWSGEKWSLLVDAGERIGGLGVARFRVCPPEAEGFLRDWFLNRALAREGLLTGYQELVRLAVNGRDLGVFLLTEVPGARSRPGARPADGPVVRWNDRLEWTEAALRESSESVPASAGDFMAAEAEAVGGAEGGADSEELHRALVLLDGFRRGEFTTDEVFDRERLARFYAVTDLLGATPAAGWRSMRLRYDPLTARLEPIGFDAGGDGIRPLQDLAAARRPDGASTDDGRWLERLFADRGLFLAWVAELERISHRDWLEGLLGELEPEIDAAEALLSEESTGFELPRDVLESNRERVRDLLDPKQTVRAHVVYVDQLGVSLAVGNLLDLPVEVLELDLGDDETAVPAGGPVTLAARAPDRALGFATVAFEAPGLDWTADRKEKLEIRTHVLGAKKTNRDRVVPHAPLSHSAAVLHPPAPSFREFRFLAVDEEARTVTFGPGLCIVHRDLVLPEGWRLLAGPGTRIDLQAGAAIVSRSPIELRGSEGEPVRVTSSDGSGQGVCVVDVTERSELSWVEVSKLRSISRPGWELTGGVTFNRAPFAAVRCRFEESHSEDALNAVQTNFRLENCLFEKSDSDAFDADYCEGEIVDCSFLESKDDAIDLSGSAIRIQNLTVDRAGDKGISAGEDTRVHAAELVLRGCDIALASKNRTHFAVDGARITECTTGLSAYRNNEDSGPASFAATRLEFHATKHEFRIEDGSSLSVDGVLLKGPAIPGGSR